MLMIRRMLDGLGNDVLVVVDSRGVWKKFLVSFLLLIPSLFDYV